MQVTSNRANWQFAFFLLMPLSVGTNAQQAPYHFKDVVPRNPMLEQRPNNLPERMQTQGPGKIDSSKWPIPSAEASILDRTRMDLLERKIELLEKRLIELESRRK